MRDDRMMQVYTDEHEIQRAFPKKTTAVTLSCPWLMFGGLFAGIPPHQHISS